jgi:ABC-2 type transport system permease protein
MRTDELFAAARLDLGDALRSRWLAFCGGAYALLAGVFVLVGLRESQLWGFTGMGRVVFGFAHALVLLLPLLALVATGQVINRAREDGTLELLFSHPLSRTGYFSAITLTRFSVLALPLVVLLLALALLSRLALGQTVAWGFVLRTALVGASLLWAYVGLGLWLSASVRNPARALLYALLLWAASVALLDFGLLGLMLQWRLQPRLVFGLAALNPVQIARLALLSGAQPDLGTLGPVGFYLATHLGPTLLGTLGLLGPALTGTLAWWAGLRRFNRGDLV